MNSQRLGIGLDDDVLIRLERRNFIFVSAILLFLKFSGAHIENLTNIEGIGFSIPDAQFKIEFALWVLWSFFLWRYYQYFIRLNFIRNTQLEFYHLIKNINKIQPSNNRFDELCTIIAQNGIIPGKFTYINIICNKNIMLIPHPPIENIKISYEENNFLYYQAKNKAQFVIRIILIWLTIIFRSAYWSEYLFPWIFVLVPVLYFHDIYSWVLQLI